MVQSWLASVLYGLVDDLAGADGLRVLMGLTTAAIMAVAWRLSRPAASLLPRLAIGGLFVGIGATQWSERPLLIGLLALALTVLAAEGGFDPRWLVPIGWIWVNAHGSFPLGVGYLVLVAVGSRLDRGPTARELSCLRWLAVGIGVGVVNPLGPRLLLFPLELLQRQDILRHVTEWQAPGFVSIGERLFLLQVVLGVLALVARPRYRDGLVVTVFLAAALLGSRNIAVASLVLIPLLARAAPAVGTLRADARGGPARLLAALGVVVAVGVVAVQLEEPDYDLDGYPIETLEHLDDHGVDLARVRLAATERVGNLLELRDGPGRAVFFDDRFDMFPKAVSDDVIALHRGGPRVAQVLSRWDIDLVLWPRVEPLSQILQADPGWRLVQREEAWSLFCRTGADLGGDLGTC